MTRATLCDQCDQRIAYDDRWEVQIQVRPPAGWLKRAFVPGAGMTQRTEFDFCSAACVAAWAARYDGQADGA